MEGGWALADREAWAKEQFGKAELGDVRRTRRLVRVAMQMARHSNGSIPQQAGNAAAMKATYRLFAAKEVTHEAVCAQHWQQTRTHAATLPTTLWVSDVCTLSDLGHIKTEGLGPIHDESELGLHQLNVLAIDPVTQRSFGLAWQHHFRRELRPAGETRTQRRRRPLTKRESYVWNLGIQEIGTPPEGCVWVHVIDRGGDEFQVFDEARRTRTDCMIRLSQDRKIEPTRQGHTFLFEYARAQPKRDQRKVTVRGKNGTSREATVFLSAGVATILPPQGEPQLRDRTPIRLYVVRAWEPRPPKGQEGVEWILGTSLNIEESYAPAYVVDGYSLRWIVEEFHKSQKTGCAVEDRRLEHTDRLEPLIGVLSVLAVYLLQLK